MDLSGKLLAFIAGVLSSVLANELKDWTPWIVQRLIKQACRRLPKERQSRFQEEWASHVSEVLGDTGKIVVALGFLWAALRMSWILGIEYERTLFTGRIIRQPLPVTPARVEEIAANMAVASPLHRTLATAVDAGLVLIAWGVFLLVFILAGGQIAMSQQTMLILTGAGTIVWLFYRFLYCLAGGDTPGMRFAGLRLVHFDGRRPDRAARSLRQIASLMSFTSAGLGLVWALGACPSKRCEAFETGMFE